jgi:hypothetical protein
MSYRRAAKCDSLHRIEIPSSVDFLDGFNECKSLIEIRFEAESHVTIISGFDKYQSLCRIEFPPSVKYIRGFNKCDSLHDVIMESVSCVIHNTGFQNTHPFIVYDIMDVKQSRPRIHMNQQLKVKQMPEWDLINDDDCLSDDVDFDFSSLFIE